MNKVIYEKDQRVPIKIWTDPKEVEASAYNQLVNMARLPFVFKHVAVMPDVHHGIALAIGSSVTHGAESEKKKYK